jgi:hypothetical protein
VYSTIDPDVGQIINQHIRALPEPVQSFVRQLVQEEGATPLATVFQIDLWHGKVMSKLNNLHMGTSYEQRALAIIKAGMDFIKHSVHREVALCDKAIADIHALAAS